MTRARISRKEFYRTGGFSNPANFRKGLGRSWSYWRML